MLVFPQLSTGASVLYPVTKRSIQRTVVNTLDDGAIDVYGDADGAGVAWELHASGLTDAEWAAIETLFDSASGMWQTFTFLDPIGNLLLQSEDFSGSAWSNGGTIQLTSGIADPFGTTRATRVINAGPGTEAVAQTLAVPGNFQYCLSVWARTTGGSGVTLAQSTMGGSVERTFLLSPVWVRIFLSGNCERDTTSVVFAVQLEAGASVELFGMQAEAQPGPSDYKPTGARGGVHAKARFGQDRLAVTAQGADVYDAVVQIVSTES